MNNSLLSSAALALGLVAPFAANPLFAETASASSLEEVVVSSQFVDTALLDLASSVSVFDSQAISDRGADNLEQLLNLAPNVNYSAGASRGRFFQIRGIGERSQFIDPVNPSVGLIIDGIDFTGLGLAASTLDIDQVEILRGPQGTLYGANALAGLIVMDSAAPSDSALLKLSAEVADYNGRRLGLVASGPLTDTLSYRFAVQNQQSDGFIENDFLGRDDTNNIDETVARGKLHVLASDSLALEFALLYINADNGYDAFSLNNTRTTLSDQPGRDTQETVAASIRASWTGNARFTLESLLSVAQSDTEYGYDEDWTYVGYHVDEYSSTDNYQRDKNNLSLDLRLLSTEQSALFADSSWVLGIYLRDESEELNRRGSFNSEFDTENYAVYGQLHTPLSEQLTLRTGLRVEQRNADYADSLAVASDRDEELWGGNISLEYRYDDSTLIYAAVSRGYKAGGVNGRIISASANNTNISPSVFEFDTESLLNYELGLKGRWLDNRLSAQLVAFFQDRKDVQAKQSIFDPNNFSFDDYLANAAGGKTTGLEVELNFQASRALALFVSAGWLEAEFEDFVSSAHVDARDDYNGVALPPVDLDGRNVAHAPQYQYSLGTDIALTENLSLRLDVEGKDEFYYSNSHNQKSSNYELFNARLSYRASNWELALWGRNLTDRDYYTRGFYFSNQFGNNPANGYAPETYYQYGQPRLIGLSGSYTF